MSEHDSQTTDNPLPDTLISDNETKRFRLVTHDDIRRWERIESRYNELLCKLQKIVNDEQI